MAVQLPPSFDGWFVFQQFMAGQNNQIVMHAIMFKCLEECTNHLSKYNLSVLYFLCLFKNCGKVCSKKVVESFQWNLSFKEALCYMIELIQDAQSIIISELVYMWTGCVCNICALLFCMGLSFCSKQLLVIRPEMKTWRN